VGSKPDLGYSISGGLLKGGDGQEEVMFELYAGLEARAISGPGSMKGLINLRDRYNLSNVVPGLRSDSSTTAGGRGSEKGAGR